METGWSFVHTAAIFYILKWLLKGGEFVCRSEGNCHMAVRKLNGSS